MGQRKNSRHAIFDLQLEDDRPGKHYSLEPQFRRQWGEGDVSSLSADFIGEAGASSASFSFANIEAIASSL